MANKVIFNGNTLIDLTSDTISADDVVKGRKFHLPSGDIGTGSLGGEESITIYINMFDENENNILDDDGDVIQGAFKYSLINS